MTIEILIEHYLNYLRYEKRSSPDTIRVRSSELGMFRRYLQECGLAEVREIKVHHVRAYISHLSTQENYRARSLCNIISGLRAFYDYAVTKHIACTNIARSIKKPQVEQAEVEHFSWEEVENLFLQVPRNAKYLRNICILAIFYYCGIRREELRNIRVSDLSEDFSELHIERGKGDKSRLLPVHPFVQRILKLYLDSRRDKNPYLFPGNSGKPLSRSRINKIVKQCGECAGTKKRVSPHIFRHSFATHLHQKGVDINRLSQLLGHANIEKTVIYTHTEDEELIAAVKKLE